MNNYYKSKTILLLGGLGLIGKNLAKRLINLDSNVIIVDRNADLNYEKNRITPEIYEKCEIISLDLFEDFDKLNDLIPKADIIFNLLHVNKNNLLMQQKVINFNFKLLDICRVNNPNCILVHLGSRLEYAKDTELPIKESSKLSPVSNYGFSKLVSEMYYLFFNKKYQLKTICFRLGNVYGINKKFTNNFIDTLIKSAIDRKITIDIPIEREKDFIYVDDLIDALLECIKVESSYGNVFNIGSGKSIDMSKLSEMIKKIFKPDAKTIIKKEENKEDFSFCLDITKIKELIKFQPKVSIEQGLRKIKENMGG